MAEVFHCRGCGGPIDDPSAPDIVGTRKRSRLPLLSGGKTEEKLAYFHAVCFNGQRGYVRIRD